MSSAPLVASSIPPDTAGTTLVNSLQLLLQAMLESTQEEAKRAQNTSELDATSALVELIKLHKGLVTQMDNALALAATQRTAIAMSEPLCVIKVASAVAFARMRVTLPIGAFGP